MAELRVRLDELETISARTLALTRYRRNHEYMNEVFMYAAFGAHISTLTVPDIVITFLDAGDKNVAQPPQPFSIFKLSELEDKAVR